MTLNKSLFNFGIFKNTVYRFKWGSLLYFIALFFSVPFMILVADFDRLVERVAGSSYLRDVSIILQSDHLTLPMLLAVVVPTVVAVLVFNNVHSSKQGIFTHGLPVDRAANYISNLTAAFALMGVPVLVNSAILMLMSFGKYGQVFSSMSVIYWTGLNLNMLFVMFSVAVFSAFLTGNIAANIGVNVFLHLVPVIVGLAIYLISDQLLFGFYQADNFVGNELIDNNPIVWLFGRSLNDDKAIFAKLQTWLYFIGAVAVYVLAYIVYKNRKIEACGDIAAFRIFKPILKYAVVSAAVVALFSILISINMNFAAMLVVILVLTAIVYFAAEMLMSKSFKVFKTTYKGYLGFVLCCALFVGFFAYTGVFGYETRIPKLEDIKSAAVYEGWHNEITFEDKALVENTIKLHRELTADIPVLDKDEAEYFQNLLVTYELKNGKQMQRRYKVDQEMFDRAMGEMYKSKDYKLSITELDNINIENINNLVVGAFCDGFVHHIALNEDAPDLLNAIKKDVEELSFEEIARSDNYVDLRVEFDCTAEENEKLKYFKDLGFKVRGDEAKYSIKSFGISINSNFKNAYSLLEEKGYLGQITGALGSVITICREPIYKADEVYSYKGDTGKLMEFLVSDADCVDILPEDEPKLVEELIKGKRHDPSEGKGYLVFVPSHDKGTPLRAMDNTMIIKAEEMPEYLKKYVKE